MRICPLSSVLCFIFSLVLTNIAILNWCVFIRRFIIISDGPSGNQTRGPGIVSAVLSPVVPTLHKLP